MADVISKDSHALHVARVRRLAPHPLVWAVLGCMAFWCAVFSSLHS